MSNLISRSALLDSYDVRKVTEYDESGCGLDYKAVPVEAIENAPAVDAVEVVRCKECGQSEPTALSEEYLFCNHSCMVVLDSDYCSYGERKMDLEG